MIVTAGTELWIWRQADGTYILDVPAVTAADGRGMPGALAIPPDVIIRPGQTIGLIMTMPPPSTRRLVSRCQACVNIAFGRPPADGISHIHHHPPPKRPA